MNLRVVASALLLTMVSPWVMAESNCGGIAEEKDLGGAYFSDNLPFDQDVFSFCSKGYPPDCWIGINPATGTWKIVNQYCFNPRWTSQYETVCPYGVRNGKAPGTWKNPGKPELMYKGSPDSSDGLTSCAHPN